MPNKNMASFQRNEANVTLPYSMKNYFLLSCIK